MRALLALWAVGCLLHAQAQRFTITSCPASSGVLKADFNARHGDTGTHAEYMLALRRAFTGDKGGRYVHYTMLVEGTVEQDYYFSIPQGRSYPAGLVSLASKSVHSSTVESKAELRALLQDTLAIWDTLCVRMRLLDADLAHDGYFLLWTDPRDGVRVDNYLCTTNPRIFACGDVCLRWKFTHAADIAARMVIRNALFAVGPFGRQRLSRAHRADAQRDGRTSVRPSLGR